MSHDDHRRAFFAIEVEEQVRNRTPRFPIQVSRGLVGEEQTGSRGEGSGDTDPLLFTAGKLSGIMVDALGEPHTREQVTRSRLGRFRRRRPVCGQQFQWNQDVLERGERRHELEILEYETDAFRPQRSTSIFVEPIERNAVETHAPLAGAIESGKQAEQRGLPAAGRAQHGHDLAGSDVEIHVVEHGEGEAPSRAVIALGEISGDDHWMRTVRAIGRYPLRAMGASALLAFVALLACGAPEEPTAPSAPSAQPRSETPVVLFLGDSLTAGYGLTAEEAFPALIQERIDAAGLDFRVVNAGVSGDTSAGGRRRIEWLLRQPAAVLVVALGGNDMLRGLDLQALRENLDAIVSAARAAHPDIDVVVAGMRAPRNLGRAYAEGFDSTFPTVAEDHGAVLVPFLLEGVATVASLNQVDGIHPTARGHAMIADTLWSTLEKILRAR